MKPTYEELEARCAALAAENAGLKSAIEKHADSYIMCGYCRTERDGKNDDVCEVLDSIPATDAFLAEVRAQAKADGVQEYADSFRHSASKIRECHGDTIRVRALLHEASNADEFAAQLRKGSANEEGQSFPSYEDCHAFIKALTKGAAQ